MLKYVHTTMPVSAKSGYGMSPLLILASRPKTRVKIATVAIGWSRTQMTPRRACL